MQLSSWRDAVKFALSRIGFSAPMGGQRGPAETNQSRAGQQTMRTRTSLLVYEDHSATPRDQRRRRPRQPRVRVPVPYFSEELFLRRRRRIARAFRRRPDLFCCRGD
jgi:hypothetical protein